MINSAGGLTGGDQLDWQFKAGKSTQLTLTTQACERLYRARNDMAKVNISIDIEKDASVHWLPLETIMFDVAKIHRNIEVDMAQNSELLLAETLILGRKHMGEIRNKDA